MISLNDDQKAQVLLVELQERYNASHKIRERSTQFTLWISGMAIGLAWLLICRNDLLFAQRVALTLLIAALFTGALVFIMGLRKGFQKNREALIRSENALNMHTHGVYLKDSTLLPEEYNKTKIRWSDHFCTLGILLFIIAIVLFILTWTCPAKAPEQISPTKIHQIKGEQ
ncbi:MAG: hypothetical protein M0P57_06145 [Syntrophales bacterium]|jgi:hypothetical protein|nr:hypothetical protein [Syntrophales bacterium]MDY0044963.1 hypothetical protein [Syntrophales bacterium]